MVRAEAMVAEEAEAKEVVEMVNKKAMEVARTAAEAQVMVMMVQATSAVPEEVRAASPAKVITVWTCSLS